MSAEEKRQTILGIYHKTKQVYTEKEIVVLAAKAGVNANTYVHYSTMEPLPILTLQCSFLLFPTSAGLST